MNRAAGTVVAVSFVACGFSVSTSTTTDAPEIVPDAGPCTEMSATCASSTLLRTCEGADSPVVETECRWGCLADPAPHCGELDPAGGALVSADLLPAGLADLAITAPTKIESNGTISGGIRTMGAGVKMGIELIHRGNVRVFRVSSLRIAANVTLVGDQAIAFVASGPIVIEGVIDGRGDPLCAGMMGRAAGPGGFDGGDGDMNAMGSGAGMGSGLTQRGGGGGGAGAAGGSGAGGVLGGAAFGMDVIPVLIGGGGGGGGAGGGGAGVGGGGGAAIQLTSNTSIEISMTGGINAGGCGGAAGTGGSDSGGGGGAGGTILLEAPTIKISGALAVNGGGGGTHDGPGEPGMLDRRAASGGVPLAKSDGTGGRGGASTLLSGSPGVAPYGGGGGGVGRIRLITRNNDPSIEAMAIVSPSLADSPTTTTSAAAPVH